MYCSNCGSPVRGPFCTNCGAPVERQNLVGTLPAATLVGPLGRATVSAMLRSTLALYRRNFRLFVGAAGMVTVLQVLELLYVPASLSLLVFVAFWPVIVGVVSRTIASARAGAPAPSVAAVYESIGWRGFLRLAAANLLLTLLTVCGLVFFIVPGLYLWVRFQFVPQAIVLERSKLFPALTRSSDLVRFRWWRVFGVVLLVYGVATVANIVVFLALVTGSDLWGLSSYGAAAVLLVGMSALWALMDPIVFGVLLMLYYDLGQSRSTVAPPLPA